MRIAWAVTILVAFHAARATGTDAPGFRTLSQWVHTAYTTKDGAPLGVHYITEDQRGFLWLAGSDGLTRFDGVRFERKLAGQLASVPIMAMFVDTDGSMWLGDRDGAVTNVRNDRDVTSLGSAIESLGTVMYITRTGDGLLWVISVRGVQTFDGTRWHHWKAPDRGVPDEPFYQVFRDASDRIWLLTEHGAFRRDPGSMAFVEASFERGKEAMLGMPGTAWRPADINNDEVADSYGALWIPVERGVVRIHWPTGVPANGKPVEETFTRSDGLTGSQGEVAFRDHGDTIWVATGNGLDKFHVGRLVPIDLGRPLYRGQIATDATGALWAADYTSHLAVRYTDRPTASPSLGTFVNTLVAGPDNSIWAVGEQGVTHLKGQAPERIPLPPELAQNLAVLNIKSMAVADNGALWVVKNHPWRYRDGHWTDADAVPGFSVPGFVSAMSASGKTVWFGYTTGVLARIDEPDAHPTVYRPSDGLATGGIQAIAPTADGGAWISGSQGTQRFDKRRFATLTGTGGERFANVSGIWQARDGELWLNGFRGLYHVRASEMAAWSGDPRYPVRFDIMDDQDGRQGVRTPYLGRSLAAAGDDKLWVASDGGVSYVDMARIGRADERATPVIDAINGMPPGTGAAALPKATHQVDVAFTAPVLDRPNSVRFEYRLLGSTDTSWQYTARREISFAGLPPGAYTFEVRAAVGDAAWSPEPATASFTIAPAVYQTTWFRTVAGLLVLFLLYAMYCLRIRHMRELMMARVLERESIARDLHDTLLQNLHAVLLRVYAAADSVTDAAARNRLQNAMEATRDAIVEGREKVTGLRASDEPVHDFPDRLRKLASALGDGHSADIDIVTIGEPRALSPVAAQDVHAIASEMLSNAFRHARADRVTLTIAFDAREVEYTVRDDGMGMPETPVRDGLSASGWGLVGMNERARRLGAELVIRSPDGPGTEVVLRVPAHIAYWRPRRSGWLAARLRSLLRR
ncbi:MAG: ATP-binding protein [Luteibacter sp.]